MKLSLILLSLMLVTPVLAQNLLEERIWKVSPRKKSIFLDAGIFHLNSSLKSSGITAVRNSSVDGRGYERLVIDFDTNTVPKIYGHIAANKKISIDFFNTAIKTSQPSIKNSKYIKSLDFISVDGKTVTMDLALKGKTSFDIFYLENPGRLVIDVR